MIEVGFWFRDKEGKGEDMGKGEEGVWRIWEGKERMRRVLESFGWGNGEGGERERREGVGKGGKSGEGF